ncbi:ATP-binding protein [Pseudomonas aeruginosa]
MPKSSSLAFGAKTYYRPIEAAIRWCGLLRFEPRILETLAQRSMPEPGEFPRWPLLRLYAERIFDALMHGELAGGRTGIVLEAQRPALDDPELTVRHVDLKGWMSHYYPGERPGFLFDDIERTVHPVVSVDTLNVLLADREAAKVQLAELSQVHEALRAAHAALEKEQATRGDANDISREPGLRSETTYLNIIGGLLTLLLGKSPSGTAYSSFHSMDAVVSALLAHHEGRPGLSERTLWSKLAQARRHLEASR